MIEIPAFTWLAMLAGWLAIRWPHRRRARRLGVVADRKSTGEWLLLTGTIIGLVVLPGMFFLSGWPVAAAYNLNPLQYTAGLIVAVCFLLLFRASHKQLARNWSVTLELREDHELVTNGLYRYIRHPMYASFWLWGIAQALLVPNWIAGLTGLASVALLYGLRIGQEEAMMREHFGADYDAYCARTPRIVPRLAKNSG
jgi:protein-S-isoprenylcysteine O-methyltransferase Ste14